MIGPEVVLAVLVGILVTALAILVRGTVGASLPLVLLGAVVGAWAGDSVGGRLGIDLLRLGDFRPVTALLEPPRGSPG